MLTAVTRLIGDGNGDLVIARGASVTTLACGLVDSASDDPGFRINSQTHGQVIGLIGQLVTTDSILKLATQIHMNRVSI